MANLLTLARTEAGGKPNVQERVDFASLTREVYEKLTPLAEGKGVRLICETDLPILILGNPVSLENVVFNLTENAIRIEALERRIEKLEDTLTEWRRVIAPPSE